MQDDLFFWWGGGGRVALFSRAFHPGRMTKSIMSANRKGRRSWMYVHEEDEGVGVGCNES